MKFKAKTLTLCLATVGIFGITGTTALAETKLLLKTHGMSVVNIDNTTMADGSISQLFTVKYVEVSNEGDFKGQTWSGLCQGLGNVTAAGDYSGDLHCTSNLTADDAFTFVIKDSAQGGDLVITGGKGKYKGATGKGHTAYTWGDTVGANADETFITFEGEGTIILP